jgi:hypothetical protein
LATNFEKDWKTKFLPLEKRLTKIENQLQKLMISSIENAKISAAYWNKVRREMDLMYAKMSKVFDSWAKKEIPAQYRRSLSMISARIEANKSIINTARRGLLATVDSALSQKISINLYASAFDSFLGAAAAGRRSMYRLTRLTQQTLLNESLIDITVAQGIELGNLRKAARSFTGQLWGRLWEDVENKHFVQAGRYKYKPGYYAELVTRTKFHEAQSEAALVEAANYSTDLVQVSTHNTSTKICVPFEGRIFSISGKDPRFPPLSDVPPYHPNCLHLLFPTFESAMEVQGTLESFSAFSKGNISRPPIPASFIPVSQRKVS